MERKSSVKEVHKVVHKDLSELYRTLSKKLGQENPFAKCSIGNGYYLWSDNRCQWNQMVSANEFEKSIVQDALLKTKKDIASHIGDQTADLLFTIPDNSYIYYNDEEGDVKILITGWGFRKPVRVIGGPDDGELRKNTSVTLSFSYDGEKQPIYEFGIQIPTQIKKFKTDKTGNYHFNNLTQKELFLKDFVTGKDFHLVVEEGRTEYDFDVTIYTKLLIKATLDKNPLVEEQVTIQYCGKNYEVSTDTNGSAIVQLPLHGNEQVIANLRDQSQSATILPGVNNIDFSFETPIEDVFTDIEVSIKEDSKPVIGKSVTIKYSGNQYDGITNERGLFIQQVKVVVAESCSVSVHNYETQSKVLQETSTNVFRFEKITTAKSQDETIKFNPHILIEEDNGFIGNKYPISVEYNGVSRDYISDDNGIVQLPEMEDGKTMKLTDGLNPDNKADYELKVEQLEYVFHVPYEKTVEEAKIKVMLRDVDGKPIKCDRIRFVQENTNDVLTTIDNNSDTYFGIDTFKIDKPISVSIQGGTKSYEPFTFSLEKNENEYLLQERNTTLWLNILLQILLVLASIVALDLIWPVFASILADTFVGLYQ
ncbi:Uncharacterised protein [Porphyromonas cangingivalis]|uniref:hypothetical protein n=1 Tax=Porphyromonas cangingivalis TaxID=36874 RepID=UPI000D9388B5|nr:hypothetical protein [Porphyromonas cangingivalis]SPY34984.1 Uncharacterised protein [Porphyromonas cangingivalis]